MNTDSVSNGEHRKNFFSFRFCLLSIYDHFRFDLDRAFPDHEMQLDPDRTWFSSCLCPLAASIKRLSSCMAAYPRADRSWRTVVKGGKDRQPQGYRQNPQLPGRQELAGPLFAPHVMHREPSGRFQQTPHRFQGIFLTAGTGPSSPLDGSQSPSTINSGSIGNPPLRGHLASRAGVVVMRPRIMDLRSGQSSGITD